MILKSLEYNQHLNSDNVWSLDELMFGNINLIVGKNAVGKTMILNVIKGIANLLAGKHKMIYTSGNYKLIFDKDGKRIEYILNYEDQAINKEELIIGDKTLLKRGKDGIGTIYAQQLGQDINIQASVNELVCVTRRDTIQHPFFEDLYQWGKTTYHYPFSSQLGKDRLSLFSKEQREEEEPLNFKSTELVVKFFQKGLKKYNTTFSDSIKKDMKEIGYGINNIYIAPLQSIRISGGLSSVAEGLYVKEDDILMPIDQNQMSQGMFRALSLIIQITLAQLEGAPSCILIDDIGEGLDFDRSSTLIKLLMEKASSSFVQLIMSTNDRFVMNNVPLKYWGVVQRLGQHCKVFNYSNAKKIFDDFTFTGLANFDFLSTEFYQNGFDSE